MSEAEDKQLLEAAKSGDLGDVNRLLEAGADVNAREEEQAWTPLMRALRLDDPEVAKRLIEAGADLNATADTGTTALMVAAGEGHVEIVELMLEAGVDPRATDMNGKTALDIVEFLAQFDPQLARVRDLLTRGS